MGSLITPHCSNCKFPFKQMMVGGGMKDFLESDKIPFSCYDCGTLTVRNLGSQSNRCSKFRREMVVLGKEVYNINSDEYWNCVFDWRIGSIGEHGYVIMNENYKCPKCKDMSLKFEPTGMWD